jgi:hypothetical protein
MRPRRLALWLAVVICAGMVSGCQSSMDRHGWEDDPLVQSKKPATRSEDVPVVMADTPSFTPPAAPLPTRESDQFAGNAQGNNTLTSQTPNGSPFSLIDSSRKPLPVRPAVRSKPEPQRLVGTTLERQAEGNYGHAPDYSWLQGVLDRHFHGHFELRFCDSSIEERWGGKVCLQDDPRLKDFRDGDLVVVRGTMETDNPPLSQGWHYPHYHIGAILLLHRGN